MITVHTNRTPETSVFLHVKDVARDTFEELLEEYLTEAVQDQTTCCCHQFLKLLAIRSNTMKNTHLVCCWHILPDHRVRWIRCVEMKVLVFFLVLTLRESVAPWDDRTVRLRVGVEYL